MIVENLQPLVLFRVARENENAFVASNDNPTVSSGGTVNIHLKNPSSSGVVADIQFIVITSQFRGQFKIYDGFSSAPSGGSSAIIDNLLMDSAGGPPDSGNMECNTGVTFTADSTHFSDVLPSGGGTGSGTGTTGGRGAGTEPILEPGREIVVQLQNDSTDDRPGSLGFVYTEKEQ